MNVTSIFTKFHTLYKKYTPSTALCDSLAPPPAITINASQYSEYIRKWVSPEDLKLYTDASHWKLYNRTGVGVFGTSSRGNFRFSQSIGDQTNNYGELWAIGLALHIAIIKQIIPLHGKIFVFTDSQSSMTSILTRPRKPQYPQLLDRIRTIVRQHSVILVKVKSHIDGIKGNESADFLAKQGVSRSINHSVPVFSFPSLTFSIMDSHYSEFESWALTDSFVFDDGG